MTKEGMQSIHKYVDGMDETYTYTATEGNNCIRLYFDSSTGLAYDGDYIEITDAEGNIVGTYKGYQLCGESVVVNSNVANVHLVTKKGELDDDDDYYDYEDDDDYYDEDDDDYDYDYDDDDDYYDDDAYVDYGFRVKRITEGVQTEEITLDDITLDLREYDKCYAKLKPTLTPTDAVDKISYQIENEDIAYVEGGAVWATSSGTTTITATTSAGKTASATLTVLGAPITGLSVQDEEGNLVTNVTMSEDDWMTSYKLVVAPDDYTEGIRVTSTDEDVAEGYVKGNKLYIYAYDAGTVVLTVSSNSGQFKQEIAVTVEGDISGGDDLEDFSSYEDGNQGKDPSEMEVEDFQSKHPYEDDSEIMWTYCNDEAESVTITFSEDTYFEDDYDYLYIYDYDGKFVGKYTDDELAEESVTITGKGFRLVLITDSDWTEYGFALTDITVNKSDTSSDPTPVTPTPVTPTPVDPTPVDPTPVTPTPVTPTPSTTEVQAPVDPTSTTPSTEKPTTEAPSTETQTTETPTGGNSSNNNGANNNGGSKVQSVSVSGISLKGESHNLAPNKKLSLKATVTPSNASNKGLTYKCSNTKYATVSSSGVVKAKKKGAGKTVTITATAKDGSGVKATYKVKISKKAVKSIKVTAPKTAKAGKKVKLKTTVTPKKGAYTKVSYKSLTTKYASVSSKGVVSIKKNAKGKTIKIQVKTLDGTNKKKVVKIKVEK
jgi:hypothetical protein